MDVDHIATTSGLAQSKSENTMSTALRSHLYSSGLLQGACADIRLRAFGRIYNLHRLFLIQAGFFRAMLCGGFAEGLAAAGSARRGRHGVREEEEGDVLDLHFDDPNMTRAAFEFCIAKLYGGGPVLVLPTWSLPLPSHPLSSVFPSADGFASMSGEQVWSGNQQPATPRFLLSLLATSIYLNIPSITSQALTLILCSVTPYTVTHYLRFAIGKGICGAVEAMRRSPPRNGRGAPEQQGFEWDWEMEGPARGLEDLGQLDESVSKAQGVAATDGYDAPMRNSAGAQETEDDDTIEAKTKSLSISSESASAQKSTDANTRSSSMDKGDSSPATPGGKTSAPKSSFLSPDSTPDLDGASTRTGDSTFAPRSHAEPMRPTEFFYGAPGEKIGEACACWLVRWGGDILDAEEAADRHRMKSVENSLADVSESFSSHSSPSAALLELAMYLCPVGTLPDSVPMPPLALWSYEQMPSAWVRAVISCDSFFVRTEWDRYVFAKRVVEMRRAQKARAEMEAEERTGYGPRRDSVDTSLSDAEDQEMDDESSTPHASFGFGLQSYGAREERMERQSAGKDRRSSLKCKARARESVSSAADVSSAFLSEDEDEREYEELFSSGIYYTHMSFQELNKISTDVSPSTGRPYAPLSVLQSALWAGSELRNHILSSTNPINALSLGHIGFPGAQTFGSLSGARAGGADETSAETGENANAQTDLGVSSALTDFEEAYDRSRTSRANSPASFAFAPQQTLGGLGASPLMMGSAGGSALLAKRYFPVPADDTVRLGDGLTQVSTSTSPPPADGRPSSPGAGESSATGVAAARDPSTVAVANPGANGHLGSGNGGAGGGVKRDRHNFFGICNITRTGGQLAESGGADDTSAPGSERWTGYEPMRVGVEFYGVDKLAEKQRLYSPTFFYAG